MPTQSPNTSSRRLIPEKTVELWNAFAALDILGPETWIWSPPIGVDQVTGVPTNSRLLKKVFVLELKAPAIIDPSPPGSRDFVIDTDQLVRYVKDYVHSGCPDPLYVLPHAPWKNAPDSLVPPQFSPANRRQFPNWTYTVRASYLYRYLRLRTLEANRQRSAPETKLPAHPTVRLFTSRPKYRLDMCAPPWPHRPKRLARWPWKYWGITDCPGSCTCGALLYEPSGPTLPKRRLRSCPTVYEAYQVLRDCKEPPGVALRAKALERPDAEEAPWLYYWHWLESWAGRRPWPKDMDDLLDDEVGRAELDDGLPSESDWQPVSDLELTADRLSEVFRVMFTDDDRIDDSIDDGRSPGGVGDPFDSPQRNTQIIAFADSAQDARP